MPYLDTVQELAEALADMLGIYNQGLHLVDMTPAESRQQTDWIADHADDCQCRICWCGAMERRIRAAVGHDVALERARAPQDESAEAQRLRLACHGITPKE